MFDLYSPPSIGEADGDLAASRGTAYETDGKFLAALDERTKPLNADA
jgi:hypothetical protein